jgi:hypothetical protein
MGFDRIWTAFKRFWNLETEHRAKRPQRAAGREEPSPASAAVQTAGPPPKTKSRLLHLGLDFGTCWSKLVLRDYEAPGPRAMVVRPHARFGGRGAYRIPSSVVLVDRRLRFGLDGEAHWSRTDARVVHSPKMLVAGMYAGELPELPEGVDSIGLTALAVVYLLETAAASARGYCEVVAPGTAPRMTMTLGVPMSLIDDRGIEAKFVEVARLAFELWKKGGLSLVHGIPLDEAKQALMEARLRLGARPRPTPREWIRSEAEAGLLWVFRSPATGEGLFGCVDVGAGTTDVGFFRIRSRHEGGAWVKDGMAFYSAKSDTPGVDAVDLALVNLNGHQRWVLQDVRGLEAQLMREAGADATLEIGRLSDEMFRVYQAAWREAYTKEQRQGAWSDYKLFVLGGGSLIPAISKRLLRSPWYPHLTDRILTTPGFPEDLFELPAAQPVQLQPFREDPTFLLVAYGLSFLSADVPVVQRPGEVPCWRPDVTMRQPVDQEEYYPR